jgi:23S rRNA (cytosine1962-C5)-methyltransferase
MNEPSQTMPALPVLRLKKHEDRRLRAGHPWVFSNEVDIALTPLTVLEPGQPVAIHDSHDAFLGHGYANPHALICARLVGRDVSHPFDRSLIVHRLNVALALRERLYPDAYYRLVYGDSDGLPGLVVDRFGDTLSVQITTAGMERRRDDVVAALDKVVKPAAILLRNDNPIRGMEGLDSYVETVKGTVADVTPLIENGVRFEASLVTGQKTGWYYDHRDNRARLARYVKGLRVLDVFSYLGAWGIQAAVAGASEVMCVDASEVALDRLHANAVLNGVEARVATLEGDAFEALKALRADRERFDVVILDPPAFIKRKKDFKAGSEAYRRLNQAAMQVLAKDGLLMSCSCSYHLQRDTLTTLMLQAARHIDRSMQILEQGHQGPDHPVHPAIPETDYLKAFLARVLPA